MAGDFQTQLDSSLAAFSIQQENVLGEGQGTRGQGLFMAAKEELELSDIQYAPVGASTIAY